ncbi:hypothetical protein JXI42_04445 [bacterium]|nr:hypothetical protein [bacterium]
MLSFDTTYWLQIIVDGDILLPRTQLTTSPYAFRARYADSLLGETGVTGVGTENYIAKWGADSSLQNSHIFETDTGEVGIGTRTPNSKLHVVVNCDSIINGFILDFEEGSMEPCTTYGDSLWTILYPFGYSGSHCISCAGYYIEGSYLELTHTFSTADTISFALWLYMMDCGELSFAIDGSTCSRWEYSVDWSVFNYMVEAGTHTFQWKLREAGMLAVAAIDLIDMLNIRLIPHSEQALFADGSGTGPSAVFIGGSVGIGTTVPTNMLSVEGDGYFTGSLGTGTATPTNMLSVDGDADISGNLGIGVTSPSGKLHLASDGDVLCILEADMDNYNEGDNPRVAFSQDGGAVVCGIGIAGETGSIYTNSLQNSGYMVADSNNPLQLGTANQARVTIENSGDVGIGIIVPSNRLHVVEEINADGTPPNHVALIENSSTGTNGDVLALQVNNSENPGTSQNYITFFKGDDTSVGEIEGNGAGGVSYVSAAGDYAEMLPRFKNSESIEAGDIVGIFNGKVTLSTEGAHQLLPVSTAPIILGNTPYEEKRESYEIIAFMGQVPVKVKGKVQAGDFILPSGDNDGVGIAVSPENLRLEQITEIAGQAWESSGEEGIRLVNVAVNLPGNYRIAFRKLVDENMRLNSRIERLEAELQSLVRK